MMPWGGSCGWRGSQRTRVGDGDEAVVGGGAHWDAVAQARAGAGRRWVRAVG